MRPLSAFRSGARSNYVIAAIFGLGLCALATGCSIGSSATHAVDISRSERQAISTPSPADEVIAGVEGSPVSYWKPGKRFYATDNRVLLIFDQQGLPRDPEAVGLGRREIEFREVRRTRRPDGTDEGVLIFGVDSLSLSYPTGRSPEQTLEMMSTDLPMLVDLDVVSELNRRLTGRELWTRTPLWYAPDSTESRVDGRKFERVEVESVRPGDAAYPVVVAFKDESGAPAAVKMSFGRSAAQSRTFSSLFSTSDPKLDYPDIDDVVWQLIRRGRVRAGMTKDQCRLSIGPPTSVQAGHDYSRTLDLWEYADGQYLMFVDGLLTRFRL